VSAAPYRQLLLFCVKLHKLLLCVFWLALCEQHMRLLDTSRVSVPSSDHLFRYLVAVLPKGGPRKVPTLVSKSLICCSHMSCACYVLYEVWFDFFFVLFLKRARYVNWPLILYVASSRYKLFHVISCYFMLFYFSLFYFMLFHVISCCFILFYFILFHFISV
jgi:hypothetical protein